MGFRKWDQLPECMKNQKVRPYYDVLRKRQGDLVLKRGMDLLMALILTLILSPVMLILAACIKADSRGPVFFRQAVTTAGDSRITRMGNLLRKCRLDELPQLFNVISGDMSFVGTRPEVKKYVDAYSDEMFATLLLPAGITSRTSIAYKDEDEIMEKYLKEEAGTVDAIYVRYILPEKMKYNLDYLKKFSIFGDIKVMIDTVFAVIR